MLPYKRENLANWPVKVLFFNIQCVKCDCVPHIIKTCYTGSGTEKRISILFLHRDFFTQPVVESNSLRSKTQTKIKDGFKTGYFLSTYCVEMV